MTPQAEPEQEPEPGPAGTRRVVLPVQAYVDGVRAGDRALLARAITLVESTQHDHDETAQAVLQALLPETGQAIRLGISGSPGVGKSTFIEALGRHLLDTGRRVAVLAVDPTSPRTGGSVLGDKTRMPSLSRDARAFVRPSPTVGTLGGVARRTREAMLLCEAAGFDVCIVETVGVGQSETAVAGMVDFLLVLMLASSGDELQGIKRGILELADLIAITKIDVEPPAAVSRALADYGHAMRIVHGASERSRPRVMGCSGVTGAGIDAIWELVIAAHADDSARGTLGDRRAAQLVQWMWSTAESTVLAALHDSPETARVAAAIEADVRAARLTPTMGAERLIEALKAAWRIVD